MRQLFCLLLCILLSVFTSSFKTLQPRHTDLEVLASWMIGSFSSEEQSLADTNFLDIRLEMVPIWKDRQDGIWMYVEQARFDRLEQPYRQRVYRLTETEPGVFESRVYELPDPLRFAGAWKLEQPLSFLSPDSLIDRPGCSLFLKRMDEDTFHGSTQGRDCISSHRGASYAVSTAIITSDQMITWDQGFDEDGRQVWGSKRGGYIFIKQGIKRE
jgi:hypothetical protein